MHAWAGCWPKRHRAPGGPGLHRHDPRWLGGIELSPAVHVVPPQGYRTMLALQLHAAAVLTDSGGVQRESAWLHTPCLILRDRTEWIEAVAESGGQMVVVGLDATKALAEVARLAPPADTAALAEARARTLDLKPAGAAEAISAALAMDA
jgi:UDP-N-acetylglucosamine 2-epimerase